MVPHASGAHPHSRGENFSATSTIRKRRGSSPLTRGKPHIIKLTTHRRGLIPTHAGKTSPHASISRAMRAHPHSRGENLTFRSIGLLVAGSSPLTRGKLSSADHFGIALGLIPTHAGKTNFHASTVIKPGAHPHSRGENHETTPRNSLFLGSSPLTRGKHHFSNLPVNWVGLIPTHAGKTVSRIFLAFLCWAHPHSRGENRTYVPNITHVRGSSPLTRGKHPISWVRPGSGRLIPTHAGKTKLTTHAPTD